MKTCYIFSAAEGLPENFTYDQNDLIIAADAGFLHLRNMGVKPDICVGDFDSLGSMPDCERIVRHPVRKDDTDTMLAVKTGLDEGFERFVLYGCAGGRFDHSLANLQALAFIAERGGKGFLCGEDFTAAAIKNGSISFKKIASGTISVFSAVTECREVFITGLLYNLENARLGFDFPLGVSNEFTGEKSVIRIGDGTAYVIWSGDLSFLED